MFLVEGPRGPTTRGRLLPLLVAGFMTFPCEASGQARPTGGIQGHVTNSVTRIGAFGAEIEVDGLDVVARADSLGLFSLDGIPVGVYAVRVRSIGYTPVVRSNIVVSSGKTTELNVELSPAAIVLRGIVAEPSYFEQARTGSPGAQTLTSEETRRAPGVQEDVVRSAALLPGVGVTSGGRNDLIVRGGAPYENLFIIDGLAVPNINHFGSQGSTGGPLSLLNVDLVERVEFATGGVSARHGNRTASVTDITLRQGANDRISGELNLSATGAGAILEGPVGGTTFWFGARRSYLDLLFKAAGFSFVPSYWDFQLKTTTQLDARTTVGFLGIGALNSVSFLNETADDRFDNSRILAPEQQQYVSAFTVRRLLADAVLTVTVGRTFVSFDARQNDSLGVTTFRNRSREGQNSLRTDLVWQVSDRLDLNIGNELSFASALEYDVQIDGQFRRDNNGVAQPLSVDTSFTAVTNASYLQATHLFSSQLEATAGVRVSYFGFLGELRAEPRLGVKLTTGRRSVAWVRAGMYHQAPSFVWLVGDPNNPESIDPIRAQQLIVGASYDPSGDFRLQLEGYYKRYPVYPARIWRPQAVLAPTGFEDVTADIPFGLEPLVSEGRGRVYGLEMLARKKFGALPVYGMASISLMRSEFSALDRVWRTGSYDVRAISNLVVGWRPNRSWELSGKFRYSTGLPTTPFIGSGSLAGQFDFSRHNTGSRLPAFHALDLRVDRRWSFRGSQLVVYLDVQNAYGARNVSGIRWDARNQIPETDESLGILPSIGVNLEF